MLWLISSCHEHEIVISFLREGKTVKFVVTEPFNKFLCLNLVEMRFKVCERMRIVEKFIKQLEKVENKS